MQIETNSNVITEQPGQTPSSLDNNPAAETGVSAAQQEKPGQQSQSGLQSAAPAPAKPVQAPAENAVFASIRRKAEEDAAKKAAAEQAKIIDAEYARMFADSVNPITGAPIRSKADYIAAEEARKVVEAAQAKGITPNQEQAERQNYRRYLMENDPEIRQAIQDAEFYKKEHNERIYADDLAAIKAKYPDETAKTAEELGEDFIRIMAAGNGTLNAVAVYEALRGQKQSAAAAVPPVIGDISHNPPPEKEFYTSEELSALTSKDLDDPAVLAKAERSLAHLK